MGLKRFDPSFLRSKVARRTLLLFVLSALVPLAAFVGLTSAYLNNRVLDHGEKRLRQDNKAVAVNLYERLISLRTAFELVRTNIESGGVADFEDKNIDFSRFRNLSLVAGDRTHAILGQALAAPQLDPEQLDHLRAGKILLTSSAGKDRGGASLIMVGTIRDGEEPLSLLIAESNEEYVWSVKETLPYGMMLYVVDQTGRPLYYSEPEAERIVTAMGLTGKSLTVGGVIQAPERSDYWISKTKLYLDEPFLVPEWTVALIQSKSDIFEMWSGFKDIFPTLATAILFIIILFSIIQIRRSLVPLEQLKHGTAKITAGDFQGRLQIRSGDEFEDLARSFNSMATSLDRQFSTITTMAEIDRLILSSPDMERINDVVIKRFPEVVPCDVIALSLVDDHGTAATIARTVDGSRSLREKGALSESELERIEAAGPSWLVANTGELPGPLAALTAIGVRACYIFPVYLDRALTAMVVYGFVDTPILNAKDLTHAQSLSDRLAVAIANSRNQQALYFQSRHDLLTGLPNRARIREVFDKQISASGTTAMGVLFIDLDRFKVINDSLGHTTGDLIIKTVAKRLQRDMRSPVQLAARLSGDEFIIMTAPASSVDEARDESIALAQHLLESITAPLSIDTQQFNVSASIGIALYPQDGKDFDELLRNADSAMYSAKADGGRQYQLFSPRLHLSAMEEFVIESELHRALEHGHLRLYYQPLFDPHNDSLVGAEALLRWHHPKRGVIMPDRFIPIAVNCGLIVPIEEWTLRAACEQNTAWQHAGYEVVRIAVNLSARQMLRRNVAHIIERVLADTGVDPQLLELEITENSLILDLERTQHTIQQLNRLGVRVTVDDFGVEYSSLNYLRSLPIDTLKIDRSFVQDVPHDGRATAIVSSIISLGHSLNLTVVAEGVENHQQLDFMRESGCDRIQGFYYSMPVPADEFASRFLRRELPMKANIS